MATGVILRSKFYGDNNYIFSNTPQHVYIDGCTGINFLGCQFNNDNSVVMFNKKAWNQIYE